MSNYICADCGTYSKPVRSVKGSILIELLLWCMFIVPGLIYSIWRHTTSKPSCRACGSTNVIGTDTPKGKKLYQEYVQHDDARKAEDNAKLDIKYEGGKAGFSMSMKQVLMVPVYVVGGVFLVTFLMFVARMVIR